MHADDLVLVPVHGAGRGRLVRTGRTVLLTASDSPSAAALVGWARLVGARPAAEVLEELTRLAGDGEAFGPFCALVLQGDGVEVLAHPSAPVVIRSSAGSSETLRGEEGQRLTRRTVTGFSAIELLPTGAAVDPVLTFDGGVIAADGFSLRAPVAARTPWGPPADTGEHERPVDVPPEIPTPPTPPAPPVPPAPVPAPAASPAATPTAAPPPPPGPAPQVVNLADTDADEDLPPAQPLPLAASIVAPSSPEAVQAAEERAPKVQGVRCSRDHFNDPRARYCAVCGIAMHQASFILVEDVRPPLGVLVFSDGSYQTIADALVIGRDPSDDPAVRSGEAQSLPLNDPTATLSRVHAEVRLVGWDVHLVDRGSTNGTFVWSPGQAGWDRLAPNEARPLTPGMHVAFGRLSATFESSLRPG